MIKTLVGTFAMNLSVGVVAVYVTQKGEPVIAINARPAVAMSAEWNPKVVLLAGFCLNLLQRILDTLLDLTVGYTTRNGWKEDRRLAKENYDKSAQLVTIFFPF